MVTELQTFIEGRIASLHVSLAENHSHMMNAINRSLITEYDLMLKFVDHQEDQKRIALQRRAEARRWWLQIARD